MNTSDDVKNKMNLALEHFKQEIKSIRTGRANPSMLDAVKVDVFGSMMNLKAVASVTSPEPRMLLITPFDPKNSSVIGKAIEKANIGIQPIVDANVVRIKIPQMDQNVRNEMVKLLHRLLEACKISIRNIRRDFNDAIRKQKQNGDLPEDQMKKLEKQIQELTDKFCKDADELSHGKEKEIMTV